MKINIEIEKGRVLLEDDIKRGTTLETIYKKWEDKFPYTVFAAKVNNKVEELTKEVDESSTIIFLDNRHREAHLAYQYSLCQIYLMAVEKVLGRRAVDIQNSLNKGLFTEIHGEEITEKQASAIQREMKKIVVKDIPFVKQEVNRQEAMGILEEADLYEKKRMLEENKQVKKVKFYNLKGFRNFFYGIMAPSTGYIKIFELRKYRKGVLLRFPQMNTPDQLPPYKDERKLYEAFGEAQKWKKLLEISYVVDLNAKIHDGTIREIIQISEALHAKRINEITDDITEKKKRIILIAGPSSSGKTTFARRLCIHLRVNGLKPLYLGTDDYFLDRKDTPLDENGEKDFENLRALDLDLLNSDMNKLLKGEEVDMPTFDFIEGKKVFGKRLISINADQPIVIEGIHGLNKELTAQIDDEEKYKIYISPLTQLSIDNHNRISTTDARMLRRMVRDYKYRGHTAKSTIDGWPSVRKGEDKNIFPYSGEADVFFNSSHIYELGVLKKYARPLLEDVKPEEKQYSEAVRMLRFLNFFQEIEDSKAIPNNSILREFIGGSVFVDEEE